MARKELRTLWITEDGKEHATEEAAIKHEQLRDIVGYLEDTCDLYFGRDGTGPQEIATALLEAYIITRRPKPLAAETAASCKKRVWEDGH